MDENSKLKQTFVQVAKNKLNTQVWNLYNLGSEMLVASNDGIGQIDNVINIFKLLIKK